jgi:hypothetical protein
MKLERIGLIITIVAGIVSLLVSVPVLIERIKK